ncbi:hypothetical protein [Candidatus Tisiphia endosymbiont of Hybos culiciformis]|uniref:hypothetical protein n=1 Tax=Candidatus Tisiphia endosymbiont of Hybos culiciformis TaxID=3139331 RepID=UPI003CCB3633
MSFPHSLAILSNGGNLRSHNCRKLEEEAVLDIVMLIGLGDKEHNDCKLSYMDE